MWFPRIYIRVIYLAVIFNAKNTTTTTTTKRKNKNPINMVPFVPVISEIAI